MGDKVTNIWKRASDEGENREEVPWHLKYGGRTLGTFAGIGMNCTIIYKLFKMCF